MVYLSIKTECRNGLWIASVTSRPFKIENMKCVHGRSRDEVVAKAAEFVAERKLPLEEVL